jgi:hypothetical protein
LGEDPLISGRNTMTLSHHESGHKRLFERYLLRVADSIGSEVPRNRFLTSSLLLCALMVCWPGAEALGLDPRPADFVRIRAVLDAPQHYDLHRVRFPGRITEVSVLANQGGCGTFDGFLFRIEDETGSIEVFDIGWCEPSIASLLVVNPAKVGSLVSIAATIVYSTHDPGPLLRARLEWIGEILH